MNQKPMRYTLLLKKLSKLCSGIQCNKIWPCIALALISISASADSLVYTFNNPSFGGNPFLSSHYMGLATKQFTPPTKAAKVTSDAQYFADQLQRRLLSSISSGFVKSLMSDLDPESDSSYQFDDLLIDYYRENGTLYFNIDDGINAIKLEFPDLSTAFSVVPSNSSINSGDVSNVDSNALADEIMSIINGETK